MQIAQGLPVSPARPAFYDRTLSPFVLGYSATGVAPHARTVRSTRTVPASTIDNLQAIMASIFCATAPGTPGKALVEVTVFPAGFAERTFLTLPLQTGAAGTQVKSESAPGLYLPAASVYTVYTTDGSTTGTVDYGIGYAFNNFAA